MIEHGVQVRTGAIEALIPAPSQAVVDSCLRQFGGVIVGALIAVGATFVGATIALASGEDTTLA